MNKLTNQLKSYSCISYLQVLAAQLESFEQIWCLFVSSEEWNCHELAREGHAWVSSGLGFVLTDGSGSISSHCFLCCSLNSVVFGVDLLYWMSHYMQISPAYCTNIEKGWKPC